MIELRTSRTRYIVARRIPERHITTGGPVLLGIHNGLGYGVIDGYILAQDLLHEVFDILASLPPPSPVVVFVVENLVFLSKREIFTHDRLHQLAQLLQRDRDLVAFATLRAPQNLAMFQDVSTKVGVFEALTANGVGHDWDERARVAPIL
jgi:hypothetical protein